MTFEEATRVLQEVEVRISARKLLEVEEAEPEPEAEEPEGEDSEVLEPFEFLATQRRYFEAARQRAINTLTNPLLFGNPKDYETHVLMRISQEAGMTFCNVKDSMGGQLGSTVEELAQRCADAEAGSKKQNQIIED
jgi:hypothetical protein